jgi:hypothetical protein
MPLAIECKKDVKVITVEKALELREGSDRKYGKRARGHLDFRCVRCGQTVFVFLSGSPHFEHARNQPENDCPLKDN